MYATLLTAELADATRVRAEHIASALLAGPDPVQLPDGDFEEDLAQHVSEDGSLLAASPNAADLPPIAAPDLDDAVEVVGPLDGDPMIAISHRLEDGTYLLVARSLDQREDAMRLVILLLAIGLPGLWLIVGLLTWKLVGRALRPVDAITRAVEEVSSSAMHRRVPGADGSDEIARLSRTMNLMLDRLERSQLRQRQFISDASHELRSPVAAIRQHAEVAVLHPDRVVMVDFASVMKSESVRLQMLVEDLLLLARLDEHRSAPSYRPVDLDDLVFVEAQRLRHTAGCRIDTSRVGGGRIIGDARSLQRAVGNLAENAVRHARSAVSFALTTNGSTVELTVDDDGEGIPPADRSRVLERFVRLDDARNRDAGGSGLGLAIVSGVVSAHHGTVHVESSPSGGARLRLTFEAVTTADHVSDERGRRFLGRRMSRKRRIDGPLTTPADC